MLRSACIGFCRSSDNKKLGTLVENYLDGQLDEQTFIEECTKIKVNNWKTQKQQGIDIIPSNDFTIYDNMLDATCLFGNIPRKYYWEGGKVPLDIYLTLARGKQQNKFDVSPLEIRQWLNTSYLYHRSEYNDNIELTYADNKSVVEYLEAKKVGIETRPVLIGPISYLLQNTSYEYKLYSSSALQEIMAIYKELFDNYKRINIKSVQIDEPSICFITNREANTAYMYCYNKLREYADDMEIHLVTYYKNIYDNFKFIQSLPVNSIHIDMDYNDNYMEHILYQANKDCKLSLGIVSAKSLWKNNLSQSIDIVSRFCDKFGSDNIIIANSSPLFLCPYSTELETEMPNELKSQLSFALEKLNELRIIKTAINEGKNKVTTELSENKKIFEKRKTYNNVTGILSKNDFKSSINHKPLTGKSNGFGNLLKKYNITTPIFMLSNVNYNNTTNYEDIQQTYTDIISVDSKCGDCRAISDNFSRNEKCGYYVLKHNTIPIVGNFYYCPIIIFDALKLPENLFINEIKNAKKNTKKPIKLSICSPLEFLNRSFISPFLNLDGVKQKLFNDLTDKINKIIDKVDILQINESSFGDNLDIKQNTDEIMHNFMNELSYFLSKINAHHNDSVVALYCAYSNIDNIFDYISRLNVDIFLTDAIRSGYRITRSLFIDSISIAFGVIDPYSNRKPTYNELLSAIKTITSAIKTNKIYLTTEANFMTNKSHDEIKSICQAVEEIIKETRRNNEKEKTNNKNNLSTKKRNSKNSK